VNDVILCLYWQNPEDLNVEEQPLSSLFLNALLVRSEHILHTLRCERVFVASAASAGKLRVQYKHMQTLTVDEVKG